MNLNFFPAQVPKLLIQEKKLNFNQACTKPIGFLIVECFNNVFCHKIPSLWPKIYWNRYFQSCLSERSKVFDWWFQLREHVISLQIVIDRTNCRAEFYNDILLTCLIKAPEPGEFITLSNSAVYVLRGIANRTRDVCSDWH